MRRRTLQTLLGLTAAVLMTAMTAEADTLKQITAASGQGSNDTLSWNQKGADGTVLAASFTANTAAANATTVSLGAANSVVSVVCSASPCSWTGTGFTAGHSLLWTSDAGNGGSGPVTLLFTKSVAGVGALLQADLPGAFTGQIQLYNGSTLLGGYTVASDAAGDPVYLGAIDQTAANITKAVFSMTTCASLCTDFGLDTVAINTAAATTPAVTLTPTSLTFASTNVGSTTAAQMVTVKNTGTAALSLTSITLTGTNASSFLISAKTCGTAAMAVGASCTVSVEFKPSAGGAATASLAIADNASGSPQLVALSGTGVAVTTPTLTLTPTSIAFPATVVGATSDAQIVTVKNTGTVAVTISSIVLGGTNATSFEEFGTCGTSLAAGASCSLYVGFKPTAAAALTGTISITDNATGSPQKVTLTGTGAAAPTLKLSATSLTFATTKVGTTSPAVAVTLTNGGTATMTLNSITLTGTNPTSFEALDTCGATLAPTGSCVVYVAFKPTAVGALKATLSIADNGAASPQAVALSGTGN